VLLPRRIRSEEIQETHGMYGEGRDAQHRSAFRDAEKKYQRHYTQKFKKRFAKPVFFFSASQFRQIM